MRISDWSSDVCSSDLVDDRTACQHVSRGATLGFPHAVCRLHDRISWSVAVRCAARLLRVVAIRHAAFSRDNRGGYFGGVVCGAEPADTVSRWRMRLDKTELITMGAVHSLAWRTEAPRIRGGSI